MKTNPFKVCPTCSEKWDILDALLSDPLIELIGYQVNFQALEKGLFYFTHHRENCGTTMAIPVESFLELTDVPFRAPSAAGASEGCPGLCLRKGELEPCPEKCECSWVRDMMQTIKERKR